MRVSSLRICIGVAIAASLIALPFAGFAADAVPARHTQVSIEGDRIFINGQPTYAGRTWCGNRIEGLLLNWRMVQGIFDDLNPEDGEALGISGYRPVGCGAKHAGVHRRNARVEGARVARGHRQFAGRVAAGLLEGTALDQFGLCA